RGGASLRAVLHTQGGRHGSGPCRRPAGGRCAQRRGSRTAARGRWRGIYRAAARRAGRSSSINGRRSVTIRILGAAAAVVALAGCAVRLGGPAPKEYQALALIATDADSPAQVAERIASVSADLVLLSAPAARDSAWFAQIATAAALQQSGPGRTGPRALGFFTNNLELLGDTSIVLAAGEGRLHMHAALYQIEENRLVDLMLVTVDSVADLREAARTLLSYISTDVGPTAAVVLGLSGPTPQASDSISVLLRAYLPNAH